MRKSDAVSYLTKVKGQKRFNSEFKSDRFAHRQKTAYKLQKSRDANEWSLVDY